MTNLLQPCQEILLADMQKVIARAEGLYGVMFENLMVLELAERERCESVANQMREEGVLAKVEEMLEQLSGI